MVWLCQTSFALVFQSMPPVLRLIISEFHLGHAEAGLLMSLFALPAIFIAIPGGIISDRVGMKRVGVASAILMVTGTLIAANSASFPVLAAGRLISGVGAVTLAIVMPQLLSSWFAGKELGLAMGMFNTSMPLGTIVSFNLLGSLGIALGWRVPIYITVIMSAVALLSLLFFFRQPEGRPPRGVGPRAWTSGTGLPIWLVAVVWMWFNAAFISFLTFSQDFFVTKGYTPASAGLLSSVIIMGSLFLSPLTGYLVGRHGREEVLLAVGGMGFALMMFTIPNTSSYVLVMVALAGFNALVPPSIFSLPAKLVKYENLGRAFGILSTVLNIGILAGPYLVGYLKDLTADYTAGFYLMSLFAVFQVVTAILLHLSRAKRAATKMPGIQKSMIKHDDNTRALEQPQSGEGIRKKRAAIGGLTNSPTLTHSL